MLVEVREGLAPATVPEDVVAALDRAARDEDALEHGLTTAALLIVRLGRSTARRCSVTSWATIALLLDADPLFVDTMADDPR